MDANKLIRIISKDLEELKTLTSEIAESENDSSLIIDLALSRARLLCQEIELLKEVTVKPLVQANETEEETTDSEEETEVSDTSISEPELEIINFEVQESPETDDLDIEKEEIVYNSEEEEEEEEILEEESEEDIDEIEEEIGEDYQLTEDVELEVEDKRNVDESETNEDSNDIVNEDFIEEEEDEFEEEESFEDEEEIADDESDDDEQSKQNVEVNELNHGQQSGIREIQIEDLDEEESESIQFTPVSAPVERPVMREIPKPEIPLEEKEEDETFQKERSLNDVISENKSAESNLGNSPISSLKSSIGLNDRFLFIREIFSNNTDKYNMVIDHLDKLETIQQAVDYLKSNLTLQKNETSMKFVELLKRRFTK